MPHYHPLALQILMELGLSYVFMKENTKITFIMYSISLIKEFFIKICYILNNLLPIFSKNKVIQTWFIYFKARFFYAACSIFFFFLISQNATKNSQIREVEVYMCSDNFNLHY